MHDAVCKINLSSKFSSPITLTHVSLHWQPHGIAVDIPVFQSVEGKGAHILEFAIPQLPTAVVSTFLYPENKLNGVLTYKAANNQLHQIKIYQRDYVTSW